MQKIRRSFFFLFLIFALVFRFIADGQTESPQNSQKESDKVRELMQRSIEGSDQYTPEQPKNVEIESPLETVEKYGGAPANPFGGGGGGALSAVNPDKYVLEPGDGLFVEIWTPAYFQENAVISSLGTINFPVVGQIPIQGVLLSQASSYLTDALKKYYRNVHASVDLVQVRLVKVHVLGEVGNPGTYEFSGITGALDAISRSNGLTKKGSLRQIELRRHGKPAQKLDYFKWRIFGNQDENPYLQPNDEIYVPLLKNQASIQGEVRRPGNYEVLQGETFQDLIDMAGGYTSEAIPNEVKLSRISPGGVMTNPSISTSLALQDGDSVYIPPASLFQKKIKVIGEVADASIFKPSTNKVTGTPELTRIGWYRLHEKERVRDVILNMGGLTPKADPVHARVERKAENGTITVIPVNLKKLFTENDSSQNVSLQDGDTLIVPPAPDSVFVLGEVSHPGVFPYSPGNQVREYMALAGGPSPHANLRHAKLVRMVDGSSKPEITNLDLKAVLSGESLEKNVLIEPGDVVYVPRTEVASLPDLFNLIGNFLIVRAIFK